MRIARFALVFLAALSLTGPAFGQTTYTWNNAGTNWTTATNWSPSGTPGTNAGDTAFFLPSGSAPGTTVQNPNIASAIPSFNSLTIALNQNFGGWTFGGSGSLTIGGTSSTGITTYGPATYTFSGPTLAGTGPTGTNALSLNVTNGSTLVLQGNSAITGNQGNINVNGGTLRLDNSVTSLSRVTTSGTVTVTGSGVFELSGNASTATTQNVGMLNAGSNVIGGLNTFRITPNGTTTILNFANSASGFTTRPGTRGMYRFEATSGNLGDASGARVTFVGTPFLGANGLLSNGSNDGTVGYATVKDTGGINFATYDSTDVGGAPRGVVAATPTKTGTTAANLQSYTSTDRVQFNPAANQTATATITNGSLRITPTAGGLTLALGANNLATNALMLDGANNFTITANSTATLGGTSTRYIYVNNPNVTLTVNGLQVANGGTTSTSFAGPGFVDLTGTASQNTLSGTNRFTIAGGVVRGNNTQIGFTSSGAGVISLTGGVLEIKNGTNGNGASADFRRPITNGTSLAGSVTWGAQNSAEIGSGGFSAFGSNASVNIGGNSTPDTLTWNQRNFVGDGYALKFGSTQSNATLRWINPIALDSTAGNYLVREINVTKGAGNAADKTQSVRRHLRHRRHRPAQDRHWRVGVRRIHHS